MSRRTIRVFIASPSDLSEERRAFKDVIDELNNGFGDGAKVTYEPFGWEETLAVITGRSQGLINQEIDRCDVFVLVMHRRWGQDAPDARPFSSYTEEEFHRAYERWKTERTPTIFVFFKDIDLGQMADPGPQLMKVLTFRRQMEEQRTLLYRTFPDVIAFKQEINQHLRAYVRGDLPSAVAQLEKIVLPLHAIEEIQKERTEKEKALARAEHAHQAAEAAFARAEAFALEFAERAAKAAMEGRVEEARQDFAKATDGTANLRVLTLAYDFYHSTGDLRTAKELVTRRLALVGRDSETKEAAEALGHLGLIYAARGEWQLAEEMYRSAIAIDEKIANEIGIARHCGNLGLVLQETGRLVLAEKMHKRSLAINKKLNRQKGIAIQYGNLGLVYQARNNLEKAEKMHLKSLAIEQALGREEGMAADYGNLGLIYRKRGELDLAEGMHQKALEIETSRGRKEGVASETDNLAEVALARSDIKKARDLWERAINIYGDIGIQHMVARIRKKIDNINSTTEPIVNTYKQNSIKKRI